jgi:hypothetical protein
MNEDFVSFEDNEDENVGYAGYENARVDPAEHDIEDEFFLPGVFCGMYDESTSRSI